ncbi:MAG: hypothetical protein DWQ44_06490 [Bacteroidetes bacterium]|nr:MAG: hypothetical protein DWQ33_02960 [Bacteroidota bacterium]REK00945.1 MAG: hypothetical protein DWQ39_10255 [Bacteroidota bacterium]REK34548.1 MAG: hypothetical protein DWQ44_06490 [Bacteroidota bacterium]REK51807.1 MAG: hypothetical protein DWQ48_00090 [Bacteroidota bacterium]
MKILVAGAGERGSRVIQQLLKNKSIEIIVLDPREETYAVKNKIIGKVDLKESLTPLTLDYILNKCNPDLIILASHSLDLGLGNIGSSHLLSRSIREELAAISPVPVIEVD